MKMRVLKPFSYSGRRYRKGEELEMREIYAKTLQRMGKAEPAPLPAARGSYRRRDMVAEEPLDLPALPPRSVDSD
jgi:hypothetical protein